MKQRATIKAWIEESTSTIQDITELLDNKTLALIMPDILVSLSISRLSKILTNVLSKLENGIKDTFLDETIFTQLDNRFLNSLHDYSNKNLHSPLSVKHISDILSSKEPSKSELNILAYLIPALLDRMGSKNRSEASVAIAKQLDAKDFRAIAYENYFDVSVNNISNDKVTLKKNHRTLAFWPTESLNGAQFMGKQWSLNHSHIHVHPNTGDRQNNNKEREYMLYDSREHQQRIEKGLTDPNRDIIGEVHTVYKRMTKNSNPKYMAVGFLLEIGGHNESFQMLLGKINDLDAITESCKIGDLLINYQKTFMPTLEEAVKNKSVLFHSWGSLKSNEKAYTSGLRFNIVPELKYLKSSLIDFVSYLVS